MDEITVTSGRVPVSVSEASRSITVLDAEEISQLAVNSVSDLLQYVNGIDLKQRGIDGIQADVSIRGGTFEQTLVMIDGVIVNDPQTGHHTLNLPITVDDIERIEVLKGQGSKSFGPNAFSGAVNFITKSNRDNEVKFAIAGGENGFYDGRVSANYSYGKFYNRISYQKKKSDGYIHNTDFDSKIFSYANSYSFGKFVLKGLFGYNDKKFGANSFYTTRFPNQWEHTTTRFAKANFIYASGSSTAEVKLFYRRNEDEFLLDYENPSFYKNNHRTNFYGVEAQFTIESSIGKTALGARFISDDISSNNLGEHKRISKGIFVEQIITPLENLNLTIGGFVYNYDRIGWKFWPGLDFNYTVDYNIKLFGSFGKSFRIPSYTELYYNDPVTSGNPGLESEETLNSELGISYKTGYISATLSLFNYQGKNIIDWIRNNPNDKWQVRNISNVTTNGAEISLILSTKKYFDFIERIEINYTYLTSDKESENLSSRYAIEYLRHQLNVNLIHQAISNVKAYWALRYEDRVNSNDAIIIDLKLMKQIASFNLFLSASNLFNEFYYDVNGVQLPGRWIRTGIEFSLK